MTALRWRSVSGSCRGTAGIPVLEKGRRHAVTDELAELVAHEVQSLVAERFIGDGTIGQGVGEHAAGCGGVAVLKETQHRAIAGKRRCGG